MAIITDGILIDGYDPAEWSPPEINLGSTFLSGVIPVRSTGAGVAYPFRNAQSDEISLDESLISNRIAYDGSSINIRIFYCIKIDGSVGDTVKLSFDYAFIKDGDNQDTKLTAFTDTIDVSGLSANVATTYTSTALTGEVDATTLKLSMLRESSGAGADTYPDTFNAFGMEIIKV